MPLQDRVVFSRVRQPFDTYRDDTCAVRCPERVAVGLLQDNTQTRLLSETVFCDDEMPARQHVALRTPPQSITLLSC